MFYDFCLRTLWKKVLAWISNRHDHVETDREIKTHGFFCETGQFNQSIWNSLELTSYLKPYSKSHTGLSYNHWISTLLHSCMPSDIFVSFSCSQQNLSFVLPLSSRTFLWETAGHRSQYDYFSRLAKNIWHGGSKLKPWQNYFGNFTSKQLRSLTIPESVFGKELYRGNPHPKSPSRKSSTIKFTTSRSHVWSL